MSKITRKLPRPEGVAPGSTATARIPVGRRIHALFLEYVYHSSTQNVGDFLEIRLFINGQVFQRFTGTQRDILNQFDGKPASQGVLEIPFDRAGLLTVAGREEAALNTGVADSSGRKISDMYMEIDLDPAMTIGVNDLTIYALESDPILFDDEGNPYGAGVIPYFRNEKRNPAGADSDFQISDLINPGVNAPDKVALSRVTFVPSTGTISNLKIMRNTYELFDRTDNANRFIQSSYARSPQAGYYTIDTAEANQGGQVIALYNMTDFRYHVAVSSAMTLTVLSEYLGVLTE